MIFSSVNIAVIGTVTTDSTTDTLGTVAQRTATSVQNGSFYHSNQIQTATMVTGTDGKLKARIRHLPYGEVHAETSYEEDKVPRKYAGFTGQEEDPEIGLVYYKFRYYDPSLGRFISPDSIITNRGFEARDFHRYMYVKGNPIKYTDPTGHSPCGILQFICDAGQDIYEGAVHEGEKAAEAAKDEVEKATQDFKNPAAALDHHYTNLKNEIERTDLNISMSSDSEDEDSGGIDFGWMDDSIPDDWNEWWMNHHDSAKRERGFFFNNADQNWRHSLRHTIGHEDFWRGLAIGIVAVGIYLGCVGFCAYGLGFVAGYVAEYGMQNHVEGYENYDSKNGENATGDLDLDENQQSRFERGVDYAMYAGTAASISQLAMTNTVNAEGVANEPFKGSFLMTMGMTESQAYMATVALIVLGAIYAYSEDVSNPED